MLASTSLLDEKTIDAMSLRVALIVADTEAEGPGRRFAIWVQGCPLRCAGCCNPEMLSFDGGSAIAVDELARNVIARPEIDGITLLGGEPFAQAVAAAKLAEMVRAAGKSVMVFSGFTVAELEARAALEDGVAALLAACDLLVDGRFEGDRPESESARPRRWIGSQNQTMYFLSDRFRSSDPRFFSSNTVELRLARGSLTVNGWPLAADALRR